LIVGSRTQSETNSFTWDEWTRQPWHHCIDHVATQRIAIARDTASRPDTKAHRKGGLFFSGTPVPDDISPRLGTEVDRQSRYRAEPDLQR
jgi:hypothetical protein